MVANHAIWYHPASKHIHKSQKFAYPCRLMAMVKAKPGSSECLESRPHLSEDAWMTSLCVPYGSKWSECPGHGWMFTETAQCCPRERRNVNV